jgi:hypothetical protein
MGDFANKSFVIKILAGRIQKTSKKLRFCLANSYSLKILPLTHWGSRFCEEFSAKSMILLDQAFQNKCTVGWWYLSREKKSGGGICGHPQG